MNTPRLIREPQAALLSQYCIWMKYRHAPIDSIAYGLTDSSGQVRCIALLNMFTGHTVRLHIATDGSKRWAHKELFQKFTSVVFDDMNINKMFLHVDVELVQVQIIALRLGWQIEGRARNAASNGNDEITFGMSKTDNPWKP